MFVPTQTTRFPRPNRLQDSGSGGYNFVDCGSMTFRFHSSRPDDTTRDFPYGTVPKDSVDKLPEEPLLNHEIKEIELITKYLDPLLNGMLNNHDKNHSFMCIDVPQSFNSLPILMTSIHKIKQIIHMYQSHCVKRPPESPKRRRNTIRVQCPYIIKIVYSKKAVENEKWRLCKQDEDLNEDKHNHPLDMDQTLVLPLAKRSLFGSETIAIVHQILHY
ncbi:unnamed protein product [Mucor circinelloides]